MARRTFERVFAVVQTTGIVATPIAIFTAPASSVIEAEADVQGRDLATGNGIIAKRLAAARRGAGSLSLIGTVQNIGNLIDTALAGTIVTLDVSGNDVRVMVTGLALTTIEWQVDLRVWVN